MSESNSTGKLPNKLLLHEFKMNELNSTRSAFRARDRIAVVADGE